MPLEEIREHMWCGDVPVRPKWQAVKRYFLEAFRAGQFRSGDMLPSENQLCRAVGVARNTVRQAMAELEKEGIIHRVRGSGTYVSSVQPGMLKETLRAYGLIIPEIRRSLYPSLARGFDYAAGSHHHQTLICNTDYNIDKQGNIILQLIDKRIAGVAIVPPTLQSTPIHHICQLQLNGIPLVFCHRSVSGVSAPLITWDSEKVGQVAGQALLEKGHRKILFLAIYRYVLTEAYERGLRKVLQKAGISLPEDHVLYGPPEISEKRDETMNALVCKALRNPSRPTAIFCTDDNEAERAYWMAQAEGIRVPQDLSIVGFGDTRRDTEFRKRLASVAVDEYAIGAKAAEILVAMSSGRLPRDCKNSHLVDVGFVGQATLGPAPSCRRAYNRSTVRTDDKVGEQEETMKKAFTLIELLVVIAIIGLLLSVLMPSLQMAKQQARFVMCGTRQRGIVTALNAYRADNDMKLPPSSQGYIQPQDVWYTIPNRLKYHYGEPGSLGNGAVMEVLGDYMKQAEYFVCPLTPQNSEKLQEVIENINDPTVAFLNCSYYLLWNWKKLYDDPDRKFRPTDDGTHRLMVCDMLLGPNPPYNGERWVSTHPFKNAEKWQFIDAGVNMKEDYWATEFVWGERPEMKMHAGYLDGRVDSVSTLNYYQWGGEAGIWLLPQPFE